MILYCLGYGLVYYLNDACLVHSFIEQMVAKIGKSTFHFFVLQAFIYSMDTSCWMDRRRRRNLVRILSLFRYTSQLDALFTHTSLKVTDVNVLRRSRKQ